MKVQRATILSLPALFPIICFANPPSTETSTFLLPLTVTSASFIAVPQTILATITANITQPEHKGGDGGGGGHGGDGGGDGDGDGDDGSSSPKSGGSSGGSVHSGVENLRGGTEMVALGLIAGIGVFALG